MLKNWNVDIYFTIYRSNHRRCSINKGVQNSQENTCVKVYFLNKVAGLTLKKGLWHRCFPVNFAKFLRITILKHICERLLLHILFHDDTSEKVKFQRKIFSLNQFYDFMIFRCLREYRKNQYDMKKVKLGFGVQIRPCVYFASFQIILVLFLPPC